MIVHYIMYINYCYAYGSLVPRLSRSHANIIREIVYMHQKAGRSGRFYAVMMMSPGRGLTRPGRFGVPRYRALPAHAHYTGQRRSQQDRCAPCQTRSTQDLERSTGPGVDAGLRSNLFSVGLLSLPGKQFENLNNLHDSSLALSRLKRLSSQNFTCQKRVMSDTLAFESSVKTDAS